MIFIFRLIYFLFSNLKRQKLLRRSFLISKKRKKIDYLVFWRKVFLRGVFFFLLLVIIEGLSMGVGVYYYLRSSLPEPTVSAMSSRPLSTRIYDRYGNFLYEVHGDVKRRVVPLIDIPVYLQEATIAIEDKNFYKHHGYDIPAIVRAFLVNLKNDGISQGASTITQQLARTLFLNQDRKYIRKIKELILAMEIEKRYSKKEILEMYLNNIPYGSVAYGISAAAEVYFDKPVEDLSFIESTYLAALPKAPSDYSPFSTDKKALERRAQNVILSMYNTGLISKAEFDYARHQEEPHFVKAPIKINAPHFVFYVLDELEKKYGKEKILEGGFDIYTSLDLPLQKEAEKIVAEIGEKNEKKYGAENASLVAVDPESGEILAMVGSRDYFEEKNGAVNVAVSPRQPGSSFKPYVYAAAIASGLSPSDHILDNKFNFSKYNYGVDYIPRNYDGKYHGTVTVRKALAGSLNIPAVKVLVRTGINKVIDLAENMGISTLGNRNRFGPSLALGGGEVKLLEHTAAFGVFGNDGLKVPLSSILKITTQDKKIIFKKEKIKEKRVLDKLTAYKINSILSDAKARQYVFGVHSKLEIPGFQVAAKTGTTQDFHDAWTIGYTPSLAVGVWSGNNDNHPMHEGANGYVVATPIWNKFMSLALKKFEKKDFTLPKEVNQQLASEKNILNNAKKDFIPIKKKNTNNKRTQKGNKKDIQIELASNPSSLNNDIGKFISVINLEKINLFDFSDK